ncbi:hypothetical protein BJ742DRAFT_472105 [Cladochytrium replicatum]|nr:hypothetical protein BJ742DRAFT_472105 [Cladochytrium replicatum]
MLSGSSTKVNSADALHRAPPPRTGSIPSLASTPFSSTQVPAILSPQSHAPGRGVVLLKDSNQLTQSGPPTSYTPLSNSNSNPTAFTGSGPLAPPQQHPLFFPMLPPQPPPPGDFGMSKKSWFQRYKWFVIVGVIFVLAAIVVPTAILVSINSRAQVEGSGSGSTPTASSARTTITTASRTTATSAPAATVYPLTLPNGAVLLDPIIRPSNNAALRFDLTAIQDTPSVFSDGGYEYHVAFARSLSNAERTFANPPYLYNYCLNATTVVMCQLQVAGVAANPDTYPAGLLTSSAATAVTVNGTAGLQMTYAAVASQFCKRQVSVILLCSKSATANPVFSRLDGTMDTATAMCNYNVYFSHSSGCSIAA